MRGESYLFGLTADGETYRLEEVTVDLRDGMTVCEWWLHVGEVYTVLRSEADDAPETWHRRTCVEAAKLAHKAMRERTR